MSRAFTDVEAREELLRRFAGLARYWASDAVGKDRPTLERLNGLIFSILTTIDGGSIGMPSMDLVLTPHEEDKTYAIEEGENWYQSGQVINDCQLHELWLKFEHKG